MVYQAANFMNLPRIETDRRLVEHQHGRIVNQRLRQADALPIALGQLPANPVRHVGQPANFEHVLERRLDLRAREPAEFRDKPEIGFDPHVGIQRRIFGQVSDFPARLERLRKDIEPVDQHGARGRRHIAGDDAHRGSLAGAVGAEKAEDRTVLGFERYVSYRDKVAVSFS